MGRMDGKVAIISGGARGMGAEEVNLFAKEGAKVVFGDILDDLGQQVEADCCQAGLDVAYTHLDVTVEADWEAIVALAEERYGRLDALVNNAGISISVEGGARNISLEDTSEEQWDRVMDINSKGVFLGTKAAIPAMRRAGGGSIVNISSIAGLSGAWSRSHPYNASKGAVRLFTKATAIQYAREGIRCNSVHPGPVQTPMLGTTPEDETRVAAQVGRVPLGRVGRPVEIAYGVLYLASDESSFVTGSEVVIDGGRTAQ